MDTSNSTQRRGTPAERPDTPAQWYAIVAGIFLLVIGILSLVLEPLGFDMIGSLATQPEFLIWTVSGWAAIFWIAGGLFALLAAARLDMARNYAMSAGVVFAVVAVWGFIDGNDVVGLIPADTTVNVTHAALGGLGLLVAALPRSAQRPGETQAGARTPAPRQFEPSQRTSVRPR